MSRLLIIPALAASSWGAVSNVRVIGTTNTQAVLAYSAPGTAACTVEVSESDSHSPLVPDMDPALFPGSNSDSRAGNVTAGRERTAVVGQRRVDAASDAKKYSRALQAITQHFFRITCGADQAAGTFTTSNIPLGSTHMAALQSDPGSYVFPTQDLLNPTQEIIDPDTGLRWVRYNKIGDLYAGSTGPAAASVASAPAPFGTNWTNASNVTASDNAYAVYSGTSHDWLVMSLNGTYTASSSVNYSMLSYINFFVEGYCSGSSCGAGGEVMEACVTRDGATCEPPIREFSLVSTEGTVNLTGTGTLKTPGDHFTRDPLPRTETRFSAGRVYNEAGALDILKFTDVNDCNRLYVNETINIFRTPQGGFVYPAVLSKSCGSTPPQVTLTTNTIDLTWNGAAGVAYRYNSGIQDNKHFGLMIRKKSTTANSTFYIDRVSYKMATEHDYKPEASSGGFHKVCTKSKTANGFYHCMSDHNVYGVRPEADGSLTVRFLGMARFDGGTQQIESGMNLCTTTSGSDHFWDDNDPNVLYCVTRTNAVNPETGVQDYRNIVVKLAYTGNDVECGAAGPCPAANPEGNEFERWPKMPATVTNLTPCLNSCTVGSDDYALVNQAKHLTSAWGYPFDAFKFSSCSPQSVAGDYMHITCMNDSQDSYGWVFGFDLGNGNAIGSGYAGHHGNTQQIFAANPMFNRYACRWCGIHTYQSMGYGPVATPETNHMNEFSSDWYFYSTSTSALPACSKTSGTCDACPNITMDGVNYSGKNWCGTLNVTSAWNAGWGSQPPDYAAGEPVSAKTTLHWLQTAQAGDVFRHYSSADGKFEYIKIIQKNSATQWVVERALGTDTSYYAPVLHDIGTNWVAACKAIDGSNSAYGVHWYFVDSVDGTDPASLFFTRYVNHAAARPPDVRIRPNGYGASRDAFTNKATMKSPTESLVQPGEYFAGVLASGSQGNSIEEHPSYQPGSDFFLDGHPYLSTGNTLDSATQATPITGSLYRYNLYPGFHVDPKYFPLFGMSGETPMVDISGPASSITGNSSDAYKFCYVQRAGECYAGSAVGQIYVNSPLVDTMKYCRVGEFYNGWLDLCVGNFNARGSSISQYRLPPAGAPNYNNGSARRVLGRLFIPYHTSGFLNAKALGDGSWFLADSAFAGKIPPMPPQDSVDRGAFIPITVSLNPPTGLGIDNAIVEFGYDTNLYCTSRAEACVKDANANEPFVYAGDAITGISCASGCMIAIPAIPQRMLYYRWKYRNSSGAVVAAGSTAVTAVP